MEIGFHCYTPINLWLCAFACFLQDLTNEEKTENGEELSSASAEGSNHYDEIVFNPNVFTEFKLAGSPEVSSESFFSFNYA